MKKLSKIILVLFFSVVILSQESSGSQDSNNDLKTFQVGQTIASRAVNGKVFSTIAVKQLKSKYFFIHLQLDLNSKNLPIRIYIYQQGNPNPIKTCEDRQIDQCFLSKQEMQANLNIMILTDSTQKQYSFNLRTYWSDLQHLLPNSSTKFFFAKQDQSQFYHLELNNTNFYELRIIMKPQTIRSAFDKVRIYGVYGQEAKPSQANFDFKSMHLWQDAEGVFLYGKQMKDTKINILIQGQIQTVYTLSCQIIQKQHNDLTLGQTVHQYLQPSQSFMYHAKFLNNQTQTIQFEEYVVTFSGFSGKLSLGFFLNQQKTEPLQIQPFEYLSDAQYVFSKKEIVEKMEKGLYIFVHALQRKSVFSINFYGRNKMSAIRLSENIYQFLEIDQGGQILVYFQIFQWANDSRKTNLQYSLALTNVIGQHELQFRTCLKTFDECTALSTYQTATKLENAVVATIGTKKTFMLSFNRSNQQMLNAVQNFITVVIVVKNKLANDQKKNGVVALEYRSENRFLFLRQGKPLQTRIKQDQYKVFKYTNQDPFLKEIKVYVSEISGSVNVFSLREQPPKDDPFGKEEMNSVVSFTKELTSKPIFLVVQGKEQSIFSIQLVTVHKNQDSLSLLTLAQDLKFSLRIKPQGSQIVQVVPVYDAIYFQYIASGSILVCAVDQETGDCEKGQNSKLNKNGEIDIQNFKARTKMFKILNPSQTQIIQVTIVYHSKDYVHCQQRHIGKLYYETIKKGQIQEDGFQNNCFTFSVVQNKDITLTLSRVDLGELHYAVAICNQLFKAQSEVIQGMLRISKDKIQNSCQNSQQKTITLMMSPHKEDHEKNKVIMASKLKYLFQYEDQKIITIPDGVAYDFQAKTTESPVKIFYYDLINKKNTTIKLIQYSGYGSFSVHVVGSGNKEAQVKATNYDFGFNKGDSYFINPTLTITQRDLKSKNCEQCSLIVKVYSIQQIGTKVHFGLQITQNHNELQDHLPKESFLTKNSLDFYSYTTLDTKVSGSLIIEVNDNSRHCSRIYLGDYDYPDEKNYIAKQQGNQLVYKDVQPERNYFIAVEALEDCPYSITVSSTKVPIAKLRRGYDSQINLEKGEVKYFLIQHLEKKEFKILSILEYGETYFYLNKTTSKQLQKILSKQIKQIHPAQFQIKSDYVNRIVLHENNSYLAQNSYYIVAVQGRQQTQGYLFYGDSDTSVRILLDTLINDQLSVEGEVFRGQFYGQGSIMLQVTVLSGQLGVKVVQPQFQEKQAFEKNYTQSKTKYNSPFEIKPSKQTFFLREPIQVKFTAIKPSTVYSFKFTRNHYSEQSDSSSQSQNVAPGLPNYISLIKSVSTNLTGTLTHGEEIFVSISIEHKQQLHNLDVVAFVEGKKAEFTKKIVRNVMKVTFQDISIRAVDYAIQVKAQQNLMIIVYQNYGLNLIAADLQVLVQGVHDYVLYPEGSILLDIFQCEGTASVLYSPSKAALDELQQKTLDLIGMPSQPHAIKILNPGPTFLRIKSRRAYFRWLPMDSEKSKGMGYLDYDIGTITYSGSLLELAVQWDPVYAKRQTNTKIHNIEYVLIVGANTSSVKDAINCENYDDEKLLYYNYNIGSSSSRQQIQIDLKKSQIVSKYSQNQNLFISIVAQVVLRVPGQKEQKFQHYRFVYHVQQVPLQVFKQYVVAEKDIWLVVLIGAGTLLLLSATCFICVKKVAPIISRLRQGSMMVEQNKDSKQFDVIPPSSDRNKVTNDNNIETQEGMK